MATIKLAARLGAVIVLAGLVLSACNYPNATPAVSTQVRPEYTYAAQTVAAQLTSAASTPVPGATNTPTATFALPPVATATTQPTAAATTAPTTAPTVAPTVAPAATTVSQATAVPTPCDRAKFVADVTYPDGTSIAPGTTFVKTWRLQNTGSCTWNSGYSLVFADKNAMNGPVSTALTTGTVAPGSSIDVSVTLKAPDAPGSYQGDWLLKNGAGKTFGIGDTAASPFWVKITVAAASSRVSFQAGATAAYVDGQVAKSGRTSYQVNARANQFMMASLDTVDQPVALEIQAPNGSLLLKASDNKTLWQGTLPADGDYTISVVARGETTRYNLGITIPVRVSFAQGAISAKVDGTVTGRATNTYLLRALKDQTMTVTIDSDNDDVFLTIYGLEDGTPYVRSVSGQITYTFKLPSTQDYVVQCVSTNDAKENYTIKFEIK